MDKLFDFAGTLPRRNFWMGCMVWFAVSICLCTAWLWLEPRHGASGASLILMPLRAIILVPNLSLNVRRLHDAGWSGWTALFLLLPPALGIWGVLEMGKEMELLEQRANAGDYTANDQKSIQELGNLLFEACLVSGVPGPLQFLFALMLGLLPPKLRKQHA